MGDKPIMFSAPMVRALLREIEAPGTGKTQTRRVMNPQPSGLARVECISGTLKSWTIYPESNRCTVDFKPPKIATGDRIWVREACRAEELSRPPATRKATPVELKKLGRTMVPVLDDLDGADGVRYLADDEWRVIDNTMEASDRWLELFNYRGRGKDRIGNYVPSLHMPRWASRITLLVTEVRVERLQDCSEVDAVAEGIEYELTTSAGRFYKNYGGSSCPMLPYGSYRSLWNSINGPGAWDENPWVAAYTFRPVLGNIDQIGGAR